MASPLIFVPRSFHPEGGVTKEAILGAVGLADHAPADDLPIAGGDGPDGLGGTLFGWQKAGRSRMHYKAAEQTWHPAAKAGDLPAGRYYVGIWNDAPPTEADLRRPYPYQGPRVELGGESWIVPKPASLPANAVLADDGSWKFELQRQFYAYGLEVDDWLARYEAGRLPEATFTEVFAFALKSLSLNYRLTPELASRMVLFGGPEGAQVAAVNVLFAALGLTREG